MFKNKYFLLVIVLIFGVFICGIIIFLMQQTDNDGNLQRNVDEIVRDNVKVIGDVVEDTLVVRLIDDSDGWQQYTNKNSDYTISYPVDFLVQDEMPNHIDISSSEYDGRNKNGLRMQIQKRGSHEDFASIDEYKKYLLGSEDELEDNVKNMQYGNFVKFAQHVTNSSKKSFMTYIAFDEKNNKYYNILVFEPGYSNNKELVEAIIKTFIIL